MVLSRNKKISVINRSAIKSLRTILQEDFFDAVLKFLEDSFEQHSKLHILIESEQGEAVRKLCKEFANSCNYIGAENLSDKLLELIEVSSENNNKNIKDSLIQVDQLYDLCRVELQTELSKPLKKAG